MRYRADAGVIDSRPRRHRPWCALWDGIILVCNENAKSFEGLAAKCYRKRFLTRKGTLKHQRPFGVRRLDAAFFLFPLPKAERKKAASSRRTPNNRGRLVWAKPFPVEKTLCGPT